MPGGGAGGAVHAARIAQKKAKKEKSSRRKSKSPKHEDRISSNGCSGSDLSNTRPEEVGHKESSSREDVLYVPLPGVDAPGVPVTWSRTTQHTLCWDVEVVLEVDGGLVTLDPGTCNLYTYPSMTPKAPKRTSVPLAGRRQGSLAHRPGGGTADPHHRKVFDALLTEALCSAETHEVFAQADASGAFPILAILVANSKEAVELAARIYKRRPALLMQSHLPASASCSGMFHGENALHVLIVNQREGVLCQLIDLALKEFTRRELRKLFTEQARGSFFEQAPMNYYGSTPFAYAVCFCLRRAVKAMLMASLPLQPLHGILGFNTPRIACYRTGFLPLHVAVANGMLRMYDFISDLPGIPLLADSHANEYIKAHGGTFAGLNPMQLACKMGYQDMVKHILGRHTSIMWKWGPVTQHKIDLQGIDSASEGSSDVMELVCRLDATKRTQELLLDSFIQGLIHGIFVQKWERYGRKMHYIGLSCEAFFLITLVSMAIWLKEVPEECVKARWLHILLIVFPMLILEEALRSCYKYWRHLHDDRDPFADAGVAAMPASDDHSRDSLSDQPGVTKPTLQRLSTLQRFEEGVDLNVLMSSSMDWLRAQYSRLSRTAQWAHSHLLVTKIIACAMAILVSITFLLGYDLQSKRRITTTELSLEGSDDDYFPLLAVIAFSLLIEMQAFFTSFVIPFQRIGVFFHTAYKMIASDMVIFMALFSMFFANYGLAMYICYPRTGSQQWGFSPAFNTFYEAAIELFELAFMGDPIKVFFTDTGDMTTAQSTELMLFLLLYFLYCLIALVVLLNLLIAMLGYTFSGVQEDAELEWRVLYARNVLRMETLATVFAAPPFNWWSLHGGQLVGDRHYVFSQSYDDINEDASEATKLDGVSDADPEVDAELKAALEAAAITIQQSLLKRRKGAPHSSDAVAQPQRKASLAASMKAKGSTRFLSSMTSSLKRSESAVGSAHKCPPNPAHRSGRAPKPQANAQKLLQDLEA